MTDSQSLFTVLRNELTGAQWQALVQAIHWADEAGKENVPIPVEEFEKRFDDGSVYWLDVLRVLQQRKAGELKLGRRGSVSRFTWNNTLGELAAALRGDDALVPPRPRAQHTLRLTLHGNREIVVTLPESLAAEEMDLAIRWFTLTLKNAAGA